MAEYVWTNEAYQSAIKGRDKRIAELETELTVAKLARLEMILDECERDPQMLAALRPLLTRLSAAMKAQTGAGGE